MSVFGFIENFFFISLALVFVLVLFLVYHFKNRISVAEKKSESMYGLLTAVVKEIKTLRGMFGLGVTAKDEPVKPLIEEPVKQLVEEPKINNNFATFVKNEPREVITLEFSAEDKIVVSDVGSDEDESSDDESELSEDSESESESDSDNEKEDGDLPKHLEQTDTLDIIDVSLESIIQEINSVGTESEEVVQEVNTVGAESEEVVVQEINFDTPLVEPETTPVGDSAVVFTSQRPSVEQLRKMNINQLKTIASQFGISTDTSKMKKHELISLIREDTDA